MNDLSGSTLGPYHLHEVIGKGGMATVYRAHQPSMGRDVALKVMSPDLADEPEFITRFEREAQIIAQLQHPHILPVYDFGREGRLTYLVMRLMTGGNLQRELHGNLPIDRVIGLVREIASALDYAHRRGIVHRDLKPTNILLDEQGHAYLTDFGIAKLLAGSTVTGLTHPDAVMGTPTYMAPEQWRSEPVDGRTDVYALGVIGYQMLTGQVPFAAETPHGLMYQHLDRQPPSPCALNPALPLAVDPVIRKALAKQRDDRYASAGDLAHDLEIALLSPIRMPEQTAFDALPLPLRPRPAPDDPDLQRAEEELMAHGDDEPSGTLVAQPPAAPPVQRRVTPAPRQRAAPLPYTPPPAYPPQPQPPLPSSPVVTGYTPPYRPPYAEEGSGYGALDRGGTNRLALTAGAVIAVLILFIGIALVAVLLLGPRETARPTTTIRLPADGTVVSLGDYVRVEFTASSADGITRVELRRLGRVINTVRAPGQPTFQGWFEYAANTTGTHELEVVAWSGNARGDPARVTIRVQ